MPTPWSQYFSEAALELTRRSIRLALDEDGRDLTSIGVFTPDVPMRAHIVAKEATHVVGLPLIPMVFAELGCTPVLAFQAEEASEVPAMTAAPMAEDSSAFGIRIAARVRSLCSCIR